MEEFCIRTNRVAAMGAGYVGGPTMAVLADQCPHIRVTVADINEDRIAAWNSDKLPVYEPDLLEIVQRCRGKNLFFTTNIEETIKENDIIFVSVNTPTKKAGMGAGVASDLSMWELAARMIGKFSSNSKIIVEKSTVPVRTAAALACVLESQQTIAVQFVILSNPEFLAEGTAIEDLKRPDRVLIGGPQQNDLGKTSMNILASIYENWVPKELIIQTNLWSAELSKLVGNAFLAQRISSINAVSALCEKTGADVRQVAHAVGMDSRVGPKYLTASVGFGGSCFQKDILNLVYLCESFGLNEVAAYWRAVIDMNNYQKRRFAHNIVRRLFNTIRNKKLAIFGFAFKKNTGDTRESAAVDVIRELLLDEAICCVYDPKVSEEQLQRELDEHDLPCKNVIASSCPVECVIGAHAILIITEWDEFRTYDYNKFFHLMMKPAFIFDGRNILDHEALSRIGFDVSGVGVPCYPKAEPEKHIGISF